MPSLRAAEGCTLHVSHLVFRLKDLIDLFRHANLYDSVQRDEAHETIGTINRVK